MAPIAHLHFNNCKIQHSTHNGTKCAIICAAVIIKPLIMHSLPY